MTTSLPEYFRPLPQRDGPRPEDAVPLAGGGLWFTEAVRLSRDAAPRRVPVAEIPRDWLERLSAPRAPLAGLPMDRSRVMGIVNVTPDSFSDGGRLRDSAAAAQDARAMVAAGADIVDIGGESTRPGADTIADELEIERTRPVIEALAGDLGAPISIDTRKRAVAEAAVAAGAAIVNDVSGLLHDPALAGLVMDRDLPVCVMHAKGDPKTMQDDPRYDDVLLDVYDWLAGRVEALEAQGIPRANIVVDPGIGFGKTKAHNLALLAGSALFHGLGCPVLIGASRKRFIGTITGTERPADRMPGSVAVALEAAARGAQILRVHDVPETVQALRVRAALSEGESDVA
ncbi:dihydropteroate synthase [Citreimonas salinaria]|uniref:Dihydropteroate synthase n=1 Tax=Citreimonas salinaria TaxID=321339 RepID=A0A1H3K0D7_9RHOB|nr:dihydropteroate synthase [Citreimonas salinaria]SDY45652.1 dihydropteroate synthase [Citreimonas salinaria]